MASVLSLRLARDLQIAVNLLRDRHVFETLPVQGVPRRLLRSDELEECGLKEQPLRHLVPKQGYEHRQREAANASRCHAR